MLQFTGGLWTSQAVQTSEVKVDSSIHLRYAETYTINLLVTVWQVAKTPQMSVFTNCYDRFVNFYLQFSIQKPSEMKEVFPSLT